MFTKYTPSLFCWFFFCNVMELYELRNDTCFLSVMSRNLTDYTIIPSLASRMLRNFTDCTLTLPFNSRHVTKLHGLPNDGCQVPRSGQARVTSQQTDGPWTKLGYDKDQRMKLFITWKLHKLGLRIILTSSDKLKLLNTYKEFQYSRKVGH